jgi:hypothetical protein
MKNSDSEDYYGLSNSFLSKIIDIILDPLVYLINWTLFEGSFPDCLKINIAIPVYKKGNRSDPNNYRPISLVPILSKVLEHCMKVQLSQYLEHNNLLNMAQYGFRTGLSTIKAVESVVSEIMEGYESRTNTCVTLIDLSKAFDSVSHDILVSKLYFYGIRNTELNLIKTYITNRRQIVKINNSRSKELIIQTGVPQ